MKAFKRWVAMCGSKTSRAKSLTDDALDRLPKLYRRPVWLYCGKTMTVRVAVFAPQENGGKKCAYY